MDSLLLLILLSNSQVWHTWSHTVSANHFWISEGTCLAHLHRWGYAKSAVCECSRKPCSQHTTITKFEGNLLLLLHKVKDNALSWLETTVNHRCSWLTGEDCIHCDLLCIKWTLNTAHFSLLLTGLLWMQPSAVTVVMLALDGWCFAPL